MSLEKINALSHDKLVELVSIFSKNWIAHDGLWFQSIEKKYGIDEAMEHDRNAMERFTVIEAKRIKAFLCLPEEAGLEGLRQALAFRLYAPLNEDSIIMDDNTLVYRVTTCRVQIARKRKNMEFHPCKSVGMVEYSGFAKTIDGRITTECVSCYPEITDPEHCCVWRFTL